MDYSPLRFRLEEFEDLLLGILLQHPDGIGEYDLIQVLRDKNQFDIDPDDLLSSDSLIMFRIHFIVFHALYRLRDRVRKERSHDMDLSPIKIQVLNYLESESALAEYDSIYEYYMDTGNLEKTDSKDVDEMLDRFWLRLDNSERRSEALQELELEDPVTNDEIQKQYRRLAMKHHPDRGGEREKLQRINAAVSVLLNSYNLDSV